MSPTTEITNDSVVTLLRKAKVKLWESPYYECGSSNIAAKTNDSNPQDVALKNLTRKLCSKFNVAYSASFPASAVSVATPPETIATFEIIVGGNGRGNEKNDNNVDDDGVATTTKVSFKVTRGSVMDYTPRDRDNDTSAIVVNAAKEACLGGCATDTDESGNSTSHNDRVALPSLASDGIRCKNGRAVITGPGNYGTSKVPFIIHSMGPNYNQYSSPSSSSISSNKLDCALDANKNNDDDDHVSNFDVHDGLLRSAYQESLERCKEKDVTHVAFSLLSVDTSKGKRSQEDILSISVTAIRDWVLHEDATTNSNKEEVPTIVAANVDDKSETGFYDKKKGDIATEKEQVVEENKDLPISSLPGHRLKTITLCGINEKDICTLMKVCNKIFHRSDNKDSKNSSSNSADFIDYTKNDADNKDDCIHGNRSPSTEIKVTTAAEKIHSILLELQSSAVQKLKTKYTVYFKILVTDKERTVRAFEELKTSNYFAELLTGWGDSFERWEEGGNDNETQNGNDDEKYMTLRVTNVHVDLNVNKVSRDLCHILNAKSIRIIWMGKNLFATTNGSSFSTVGESNIRKILRSKSVASSSNETKRNEFVCIVSGSRDDSSLIQSIRTAARTIQSSRIGSRFEVTDQEGRLVSMKDSDTISFLTALGLHRLGRSRMAKPAATSSSTITSRDATASALVFFLEADIEWQSPALDAWKKKVDNYGLLQLDIAWCYLLLESLDSLPDAIRRLNIAETVLRNQVHKNFVTLAIANAEMNNPIPPFSAIFVRLFLLQGVAYRMQHNLKDFSERLEWARVLCFRLRNDCSQDKVNHLCNALLVDRHTAICALRQSNGDLSAAGNVISDELNNERSVIKKRGRQRSIGKCFNGIDYVNLEIVSVLSDFLGFPAPSMDECDEENEESLSTSIVVGLLRLSNNDIEQSLELYRTLDTTEILRRIDQLDKRIGKRVKEDKQTQAHHQVQDTDIAMLLSMGVDESKGREALKMTGNVDEALLWLSKNDGNASKDVCDSNESDNMDAEDIDHDVAGDDQGDINSTVMGQASELLHNLSRLSREKIEAREAHDLLITELGNVVQDSSKDLQKEWTGADLEEEWNMITKYL